MLVIRYLRTGKKNQPFFRVVVTDKKNPPKAGRFLEIVGFVNPLTKEKQIKVERIKYWMSKGAQVSDTVHNLLIQEKALEGKKIDVRKKPKKKAQEAKAKAQTATAEKQTVSTEKAVGVVEAEATGEAEVKEQTNETTSAIETQNSQDSQIPAQEISNQNQAEEPAKEA